MCITNLIHKQVAIRVLPHFVNEKLANTLNSRMCTTDKPFPISASVRNLDNSSRKLLRFYPEVVDYLQKSLATDKPIVEFYTAILGNLQPANMTAPQNENVLVVKSCGVADVYIEETLNYIFIKNVESSV